jgi:hypothetical protein
MITPRKCFLVDGPLMNMPEHKERRVLDMAEQLIEHDAYADSGDARRLLRALGWSMIDVELLLDDARQVAFSATLDIVATEMSGS